MEGCGFEPASRCNFLSVWSLHVPPRVCGALRPQSFRSVDANLSRIINTQHAACCCAGQALAAVICSRAWSEGPSFKPSGRLLFVWVYSCASLNAWRERSVSGRLRPMQIWTTTTERRTKTQAGDYWQRFEQHLNTTTHTGGDTPTEADNHINTLTVCEATISVSLWLGFIAGGCQASARLLLWLSLDDDARLVAV